MDLADIAVLDGISQLIFLLYLIYESLAEVGGLLNERVSLTDLIGIAAEDCVELALQPIDSAFRSINNILVVFILASPLKAEVWSFKRSVGAESELRASFIVVDVEKQVVDQGLCFGSIFGEAVRNDRTNSVEVVRAPVVNSAPARAFSLCYLLVLFFDSVDILVDIRFEVWNILAQDVQCVN